MKKMCVSVCKYKYKWNACARYICAVFSWYSETRCLLNLLLTSCSDSYISHLQMLGNWQGIRMHIIIITLIFNVHIIRWIYHYFTFIRAPFVVDCVEVKIMKLNLKVAHQNKMSLRKCIEAVVGCYCKFGNELVWFLQSEGMRIISEITHQMSSSSLSA